MSVEFWAAVIVPVVAVLALCLMPAGGATWKEKLSNLFYATGLWLYGWVWVTFLGLVLYAVILLQLGPR